MTIDPLDPAQLDELLVVLKARGVESAKVTATEVWVRFGPSYPEEPLPGETPTPGGWKGPERLDAPQQLDDVP